MTEQTSAGGSQTDPGAPDNPSQAAAGASQDGADAGQSDSSLETMSHAELVELTRRTRSEAAKYRTRAKELEPLAARAKELEDAGKTELQRMTETLTAAQQRAEQAESQLLRMQVAAQHGIPTDQAHRLVGTTAEELAADAAALATLLTPAGAPAPAGRPQPARGAGALAAGSAPEIDVAAELAKLPRW